ncbi:unnamed protein product, partial [Discosporangium mesarthrocarpum]
MIGRRAAHSIGKKHALPNVCFIDLQNAYYLVHGDLLWFVLARFGVPIKLMSSAVRLHVVWVCVLSPLLSSSTALQSPIWYRSASWPTLMFLLTLLQLSDVNGRGSKAAKKEGEEGEVRRDRERKTSEGMARKG